MFIGLSRHLNWLVVAIAFVSPGSAFAACKQSDLAGIWRFNLDVGVMVDQRVMKASCIVVIKANGTMTPGACISLAGGGGSTLNFSGPSDPLTVAPSCEANWGNANTFMAITVKGVIQLVQKMRLTLASDKHALLGYGTINDPSVGIVSVHGIRRSP